VEVKVFATNRSFGSQKLQRSRLSLAKAGLEVYYQLKILSITAELGIDMAVELYRCTVGTLGTASMNYVVRRTASGDDDGSVIQHDSSNTMAEARVLAFQWSLTLWEWLFKTATSVPHLRTMCLSDHRGTEEYSTLRTQTAYLSLRATIQVGPVGPLEAAARI